MRFHPINLIGIEISAFSGSKGRRIRDRFSSLKKGVFASGVPAKDARREGAQKLQLVDAGEPDAQTRLEAGADGRADGLGQALSSASYP